MNFQSKYRNLHQYFFPLLHFTTVYSIYSLFILPLVSSSLHAVFACAQYSLTNSASFVKEDYQVNFMKFLFSVNLVFKESSNLCKDHLAVGNEQAALHLNINLCMVNSTDFNVRYLILLLLEDLFREALIIQPAYPVHGQHLNYQYIKGCKPYHSAFSACLFFQDLSQK